MAGLAQFISVKLQPQPAMDENNQMAASMKTMTYTMPLFSVFLGFTLPAGLGLYWAVSAVVRCVQQVAINKYLQTKSLDDMIKEIRKKLDKKTRRKRVHLTKELNKMATTSTKNVEHKKTSTMSEKEDRKIGEG